ncbi:MAG: RdgB/HAM1 family non-canonical purine NTP pyrophosphatase [Rhodospirillales bacterium]|jgi:XTP/dITP diphosphohydrolase|nr:RdgB/HAM1 family non-canonical purine NTP pyrophosphatase [Rhodospirillales bacterium]
MARLFQEQKLVIASHNAGKVREIDELLAPFGVEALNAGELGLSEPVEDGDSFIANAIIKAQSAASESGLAALADDSGLCIDVLGGSPGIHSARWAGPEKDFGLAMDNIMEATADFEEVKAHFTCALALCWPPSHANAGSIQTFEGYVHGKLDWPTRGDKGFGYDPIFVPDGYDITFAEMEPSQKHAMSHRASAFNQLVAACFQDT